MVNDHLNEVQVIDFGLAGRLQKAASTISGTPDYMSPVQWTGDVQDGRTDQFSLGVVAYELLPGRNWRSESESQSMGQLVIAGSMPKIASLSVRVNEVLSRCLARSKDDRFSSCNEFVDYLSTAVS